MKVTFAYNEPGFGTVDIEGPDVSEDYILDEIEKYYPSYIDVDILEIIPDAN